MMELIVFAAPFIAIAILIILLVMLLTLAIIDLIQLRKPRGAKSRKSHMTIIATIHNDQQALEQFVKQLKAWRVKSFDLVLVRPLGSAISRSAITRATTAVKFRTYVYSPRTQSAFNEYAARAYARSKKGERVLLTNTSTMPKVSSLRYAMSKELTSSVIVRFQSYGRSNGLLGVMSGLHDATIRLLTNLSRKRSFKNLSLLETYLVTPDQLFARNKTYKIKDELRISYRDSAYNSRTKITFNKNAYAVAGGLASICLLYIMSSAAIEGYGLEAFTIAWLASSFTAVILLVSDSFTTTRQKLEALLCVGFMPIVVIVSIFVRKA